MKKIGGKNCVVFLPGLLVVVFVTVGCVTEIQGLVHPRIDNGRIYSAQEVQRFLPLLKRYNLDPPLSSDKAGSLADEEKELFPPYQKYSKRRYLCDDGSTTLHYYLEAGTGSRIASLLASRMPHLKIVDCSKKNAITLNAGEMTVIRDYLVDNRRTAGIGTTAFARYGADPDKKYKPRYNVPKARSACDLLVVKAESKDLLDVEQYTSRILTELPQIEIRMRIIEVTFNDRFEYGIDSVIYRVTSSEKSFLKTEFDEDGNYVSGGWTTKFHTESFLISGEEDFQGSIFHVAGEHDKLFLDALIEVAQKIGESQILTAPHITVLDKQKAVIETGTDVPVITVHSAPSTTTFNYVYKPTGVTLTVVPSLLMDDVIQLEINGEARLLTGEETANVAVGTTQIPVFSNRNISSTVFVRDNEAVALGGLFARREVMQISKVPLLGDIPVLGYLFKSKMKELKRTEIILYIEARIVRGSEALYSP